jgi:hypothetical protein
MSVNDGKSGFAAKEFPALLRGCAVAKNFNKNFNKNLIPRLRAFQLRI